MHGGGGGGLIDNNGHTCLGTNSHTICSTRQWINIQLQQNPCFKTTRETINIIQCPWLWVARIVCVENIRKLVSSWIIIMSCQLHRVTSG